MSRESGVIAFLRQELAPSPARRRATLRLTVLCALGVTLVMALYIPDGEFLLVSLFVVSQSDVRASLTKALHRLVGTLAGGALALLAIVALADKPWFLFPLQALVIGAVLFLSRTTTAPYAFVLGGMTFLITTPEFIASPEQSLDKNLWRIALTAAGVVLAAAGQIWLWPNDPEAGLLEGLIGRIRCAEAILTRALGDAVQEPAIDGGPPDHARAIASLTRQLDLLASAEASSPSLKQRHTEQIKWIADAELLMLGALRLDGLRGRTAVAPDDPEFQRLQALRRECLRLRQALERRRPPEPSDPQTAVESAPLTAPTSDPIPEWRVAIHEMERAVAQFPAALAFLDETGNGPERTSAALGAWRATLAKQPIFTPECTLSNVPAIRFALKGALAASICGLVYQALNWPSAWTCVLTVMVVAQSTVGASLRKSLLRFAGAALGGLAALLVIAGLMPNLESLASLLMVTAPLYAAAAWLTTGSSRISYVGLQMAIALCLVLINTLGPTTDLAPAGDRLFGILLGITVMSLIDLSLWPVFAGTAMRQRLAAALRHMAVAQRLATPQHRESAGAALFAIYRELTGALGLQDDVLLEPGSRSDARAAGSHSLLRVASGIQDTFLAQIAADRQRFILQQDIVPGPLAEHVRGFDEAIASHLEALAGALEAARVRDMTDLGLRLYDLDCASQRAPRLDVTAPNTAALIEDQVVLDRDLVAALLRLEGDIRSAVSGRRPEPAAGTAQHA